MANADLEGDDERESKKRDSQFVEEETSDAQWTSWLIPMVVVSNVVVFVFVMYVNNCPDRRNARFDGRCVPRFLGRFSFQSFKENPLLGPSSDTLEKLGALEWKKVVHEAQGWRLITCVWLHAGVIHLLTNMISLAVIGIRLEQQFGFIKIGIIYMLSGFGGSILSCLFLQQNISVGASSALFGLLGAMLSELLVNWTIYTNKAAALIMILMVVVINLALGTLPRVDNFAHIGGFVPGFLLGFVLLMRPQFTWEDSRFLPQGVRRNPKYNVCQQVLCVLGLLLLIAGFAFGLVMLFRGENIRRSCGWCHY